MPMFGLVFHIRRLSHRLPSFQSRRFPNRHPSPEMEGMDRHLVFPIILQDMRRSRRKVLISSSGRRFSLQTVVMLDVLRASPKRHFMKRTRQGQRT